MYLQTLVTDTLYWACSAWDLACVILLCVCVYVPLLVTVMNVAILDTPEVVKRLSVASRCMTVLCKHQVCLSVRGCPLA